MKSYESNMKQFQTIIDNVEYDNDKKISENIDSIFKISNEKKNEIDSSKLEEALNACLNQIEAKYVPDFISTKKLRDLTKSIHEKKLQLNEKKQSSDKKANLSKDLISKFNKFDKIEKWTLDVKEKLTVPIGNNFDDLEKQYETVEEVLFEYTTKLSDIEELNEFSSQNFEILNNELKNSDFVIKLNKINQEFDSISKNIQDRKNILLNSLDKIKTLNENIDALASRAQELNINLNKTNDLLDRNNLEISEKNENIKILDNERLKLKKDIDLIKSKIDNKDDLTLKFENIDSKFNRIESIFKEINGFIYEANSNMSNFENLFKQINYLVEQNQSKLEKIVFEIKTILMNEENPEFRLKELSEKVKNISKHEQKVNEINKYGDKFYNTSSIMEKLTMINSNYDILNKNLESTISFTSDLIGRFNEISRNEQFILNEISTINEITDSISRSFPFDEDCDLKSYFDRIDSLQNVKLKKTCDCLEDLNNSQKNLDDCIHNFYLLHQREKLDHHQAKFKKKIEAINKKKQTTENQLKQLKDNLSEYSIEKNNFDKKKEILLNFINYLDNEILNQQNFVDLVDIPTKKDFCEKKFEEMKDFDEELENLVKINRVIDKFKRNKQNSQNTKIKEIQDKYGYLLENLNFLKGKVHLCEKYILEIKNYKNKYQILEDESIKSINESNDVNALKNYLTKLDDIIQSELLPIMEKFNNTGIEIISKELDEFKTKAELLKSEINQRLIYIEQTNKKTLRDELEKAKSTLLLLENDIDLNVNLLSKKNEMKQKIENIFSQQFKFKDTLKIDDPLHEQIIAMKTHQINLIEKLDRKYGSLSRLTNLETRVHDIGNKIQHLESMQNYDINSQDKLKEKISIINDSKTELIIIKDEAVQFLDEIQNTPNLQKNNSNFSESVIEFKTRVEEIIERCQILSDSLADKETQLINKLNGFIKLEKEIQNLSNQIIINKKDLETKFEQTSPEFFQLDDLKDSLDNEMKKAEDFKIQIDKISNEIKLLGVNINKDHLEDNFSQFENSLKKIKQKLEFSVLKSCEYEERVLNLESNLTLIENELDQMSKIKYNFSNLESIDKNITDLETLMKKLVDISNQIDDFKELCERMLQNFNSSNSCNLIEKTMDKFIHKWNQMTRKVDEMKNNYIFLNKHLKNIAHDYHVELSFLESLQNSSSCNLVLNCVDPTVIKYQFEKMRSTYDNLQQRSLTISEIKQDANHLIRLNHDFETKLHLKTEILDSDNKYLEYLTKSASVVSLNNLVNLLDSNGILKSINDLEDKNSYFKEILNVNINVFHRLYPICDKLSLNLSKLNQSISILDSDLDWLDNSKENEISQKDKKEFFEKLHTSILYNYKQFEEEIQNTICSRIIDEINLKNIECNELINDLNQHIEETSGKLDNLSGKYKQAYENFQSKQSNSKEIYSEMNDILEWLDMVESKYSDSTLNISHDNSIIENELKNQIIFNDEVQKQKLKLRQIDLKSQQMIRQDLIEDSIEFKEKLVNLHFQLDNYIEIGINRVNRLEEALVISKELKQTYEPFIKSMTLIQDRLDLLDNFNLIESGVESKEFLMNKLLTIEEISHELLEKKSDLEILIRNSKNMIKICECPKNYITKQFYPSTDSNFEEEAQNMNQRDTNFELKKIIDFANQTFNSLKTDLDIKKDELENILWKSADLTDKIHNLNSNLKIKIDFIESNDTISTHPDKIRTLILDNKTMLNELYKRKQEIDDIKEHSLIKSSEETPELSKKIIDLEKMVTNLNKAGENREKILSDSLKYSELFWNNYNFINDLISDLDERLQLLESETVAIDPDSVLEQQQYHQQIIKDIDEHEAKLVDLENYGNELIKFCCLSDRIDIEKAIEDCTKDWNRIKKSVKNHEINIQMTFSKACEFQQELIEILEWISLQQEKFVNLDSSLNSDDPKTIRFQINLLKEFKEKVDPKQMRILILNHKFDDLKLNIRTNQSFEVLESLQEPLNSANKEWKRLQSSINERKSNLQNILIDMGQLNEALDEIGKSVDTTINSLESIEKFVDSNSDIPFRTIDLKMARLKMIEKEIKSQGYLLERSKNKCNHLLNNESFENPENLNELKSKINSISDTNESMVKKFKQLQQIYDKEQTQTLSLVCELTDSLEWLKDLETALDRNFLYGGLPETAREQLDKFQGLFQQIESNQDVIDNLILRASNCHESNLTNSKVDFKLKESFENLSRKWSLILKKSSEKKEKLESALNKANEFNEKYHEFIRWLNETEKCFNSQKQYSKIQSILDEQIVAHQNLQISINNHRDHILELDRLGTHLKYYSQKQDGILIKNLLISVQNRWEKIVSKSSIRTRDLERGYQEVRAFYDQWNKLNEWLDSKLSIISQDQQIPIGNNSIKIKQQIAKHADFHRIINNQQSSYDKIIKNGRKLYEKCDKESKDRIFIQEIILEIKNKWKILCMQSVERQKKLEEALLCSGQFQDALINLTEWLRKVKPTLNTNESLYGDLDNVLALIEDNQQFQKQLQLKAEQVLLINNAAQDIIQISNDKDEDIDSLNNILKEMNELWKDVDELSKDRTKRLEESLKLATEFNDSMRACIEWLKNTELVLRQDWRKFDENQIQNLIKEHQDFIKYLNEKKQMIDQCLDLGNSLLENCIPEAVINLKHYITFIENKCDEIFKLSDEKLHFLNEVFENLKKNDDLLNELLMWLQGAEATLTASNQKPLPNSLEIIDQLLKDHYDFQNELQQRQVKMDALLGNTAREFDSYLFGTLIESKKKSNYGNKNRFDFKISEPKIKNSRIKLLFDSWRKVWLMTLERQKKLKEFSERLKEIEKLKEFDFNEWRQRFMNWHKDNRARITDFFRRQDKDHDGKISRDEFVKGILNTNFPSSRLELECVADIFDHDKDGFIDYKEFLATLKPSISNQPNFERIRDEVHRQVSLCKCSKQYHVLQVSERHFRFGDSQKLRLVRILQSTVMVRVGGGWMALDEFLIKNDPCRARGRLNIDLRDQFMNRESNIENLKSPSKFKPRTSLNISSKKNQSLSLNDQSDFLPNTPILSAKNSKNGSLDASISDLSVEVLSENAENLEKLKTNNGSIVSPPKQSKLPILKRN